MKTDGIGGRQLEPTVSSGSKYIPGLDGLRAVACGMVLVGHLPAARFPAMITYGGVSVFFALSGFLITRLLLAERDSGAPLRGFYFRRFFRIFPAYYVLLAGYFLICGLPAQWWAAVFYVNNYWPTPELPHLWSLSIEEQFYLVWPILIFTLSRKWSFRIVALATGMAYAWPLFPHGLQAIYSGNAVPTRLAVLGIGAMVAYREEWLVQGHRLIWLAAALAAGYLAAPFYAQWLAPGVADYGPVFWMRNHLLGGTALCLALWKGWPTLQAVLCDPALRYVGKISYGIYLLHVPVYYCFGVWSPPKGLGFTWRLARWTAGYQEVCAIAVTIFVAAGSYKLMESRLIALGHKLSDRSKASALARAAAPRLPVGTVSNAP